MTALTMFLDIMTGLLMVAIGMLIRQILEMWKDYHIEKALYEAKYGVKHTYRRIRTKPTMPKEILEKFMKTLREKKHARAVYDHGRWMMRGVK